MRKEDRVRQQQSQGSEPRTETPPPRPDERIKGVGSDESKRPPREPGKLPLPE